MNYLDGINPEQYKEYKGISEEESLSEAILPVDLLKGIFSSLQEKHSKEGNLVCRFSNKIIFNVTKNKELQEIKNFATFLNDYLIEKDKMYHEYGDIWGNSSKIFQSLNWKELKYSLNEVRKTILYTLISLDSEDIEEVKKLAKEKDVYSSPIFDMFSLYYEIKNFPNCKKLQRDFVRRVFSPGKFDRFLEALKLSSINSIGMSLLREIYLAIADVSMENVDRALEVFNALTCPQIHDFLHFLFERLIEKDLDKATEIAYMIPDDPLIPYYNYRNSDLFENHQSQKLKKICTKLFCKGKVDKAIKIAETISDEKYRDSFFGDKHMYRCLINDGAIKKSLQLFNKITNSTFRDEFAKFYIGALLEVDKLQVDVAIAVASKIITIEYKDWIYDLICQKLHLVGQIDEAIKFAHKITDIRKKDYYYIKTCDYWIDSRQINKALELAHKITHTKERDNFYLSILSYFREKNEIDEAIKVADKITDIEHRDSCYYSICLYLIQINEIDKAMQLAHKIFDQHGKNDILKGRTS